MVESIMYFGAGFLVATLLALVLVSFVHHRAVRLTLRRLEDATRHLPPSVQRPRRLAHYEMVADLLPWITQKLRERAEEQRVHS